MKNMRPRLTFANVISCLALFVALGGSAYAATQLKKNSVGTKQVKNGSITPAKLSAGAKKSLRGAKGELGPKGEIGPRGEAGASAALWAAINAEGKTVHGSGVVSSSESNKGVYTVTFNRDVSACTYVASAGVLVPVTGINEFATPGQSATAPLKGNADGVVITRGDPKEGEASSGPVSIAVFC